MCAKETSRIVKTTPSRKEAQAAKGKVPPAKKQTQDELGWVVASFKMEEELYVVAKSAARTQDRSFSSLVRAALKSYLDQK